MNSTPPMICISLRYADAVRMYDWLIAAFGFEKHAAFYSEDRRTLHHGELRMGSSFVMLGSSEGNELGKLVSRPGRARRHHRLALYRDRRHRCPLRAGSCSGSRDLHGADRPALWQPRLHRQGQEGHVWCFGTYRPGEAPA